MEVVNVKVAHIRPKYENLKEWCADPANVYIGRAGVVFVDGARYPKEASPYANPFKVGRDGAREDVIAKYEVYLADRIAAGLDLSPLKGKRLGCWCKPAACHGDILTKYVPK